MGDHPNSSIILQKLFTLNHNLFVRAMCEIAHLDQKTVNLSRVLDIT